VIISLSNPRTVELLEQYARYVARNDDVAATPGALVEGMLLGFLDEHDGFRNFIAALATPQTPPQTGARTQRPHRLMLDSAASACG